MYLREGEGDERGEGGEQVRLGIQDRDPFSFDEKQYLPKPFLSDSP